jgi:hypothetical protein
MSNAILIALQQPGASFSVGNPDAGSPNWSNSTIPTTYAGASPQFGQGLVEYAINEFYRQVLGEVEDLEINLISFSFSSTIQTYKYAIPLSGYANISHVARVFYKPSGLPYTWEYAQGQKFISWNEFQAQYTGQGYLLPYSFGTQPDVCAVDPLLTSLYFFPGSAIAGDTITVEYSPIPTPGATGCPTLVNATDAPILPVDCHMAIVYGALSFLWIRARESQMAGLAAQQYREEIQKIRMKYVRKTHGDTIRIRAFSDRVAIGNVGPW